MRACTVSVYEALNREDACGTVYGMINGIEGFLNDRIMDMEPLEKSGELELIRTTPGSYLGSCRYKLPEDLGDEVYPKLFEKFEQYGIGYFFYIGGNDSMDTVSKLSRYAEKTGSDIRFMGIPKTIDKRSGTHGSHAGVWQRGKICCINSAGDRGRCICI